MVVEMKEEKGEDGDDVMVVEMKEEKGDGGGGDNDVTALEEEEEEGGKGEEDYKEEDDEGDGDEEEEEEEETPGDTVTVVEIEEEEDDNGGGEEEETPPVLVEMVETYPTATDIWLIDTSIMPERPTPPQLIETNLRHKLPEFFKTSSIVRDRHKPPDLIDTKRNRHKPPELIETSIVQPPEQKVPELIDTSITFDSPQPPELIETSTVQSTVQKPPELIETSTMQSPVQKVPELIDTSIKLDEPKVPELIETKIVQSAEQKPPEFFTERDRTTSPKMIETSIVQEKFKPPELIDTSIKLDRPKPPELIETSILQSPVQKPPELIKTTTVQSPVQKPPELIETNIIQPPVQKVPELIKIVGDRPMSPKVIETSIVQKSSKPPELINTSTKPPELIETSTVQSPVQKPSELINIVRGRPMSSRMIGTSIEQETPKPLELIESSIVQSPVQKPPKLINIVSGKPLFPKMIGTSNVQETPKPPELIKTSIMPPTNVQLVQEVTWPPPPPQVIVSQVEIERPTLMLREMYFLQPVDHFTFTSNNRTFLQRYLFTDQFGDSGNGPIFFYTGNEGDIWNFANNSGFIIEQAAEQNALVVFAEHRYYGKSLPFGTKSFEKSNIVFLSVEQALADFVVLLTKLKTVLDAEDSPVIAFGGSYGGMLSAYMRMKYPNIVLGALASSAPIFSTAGIGSSAQFFRDVTKEFERCNSDCPQQIREAFQALEALGQQEEWNEITNKMHLCEAVMSLKDIERLYGWARNGFTVIAMYNYPYQMNTPRSLPENPVNIVCRIIELIPDPIEALRAGLEIYYNISGDLRCFDIYTQFMPCADPTGCALGSEGQAWDFQACTEINLLYESNGLTDMFPAMPFTETMREEYCHRKWGVRPSQDWLKLQYWGNDLTTASNIIFSNGILDPWANGGVLKNVSSSVIALIIDGAAHHLDLRGSHPRDPAAVTLARKVESLIIKTWVKKHQLYITHVYSKRVIT
eukprot:gi/632957339/ref/XP_007894423.1/ PREDICTED: dipeptidyl peptidase 2 [Callorhinchus milii]